MTIDQGMLVFPLISAIVLLLWPSVLRCHYHYRNILFKVKYNSLVNTGHDWTSKQSQKSKAAATSLIGKRNQKQLICFEIYWYIFARCGKLKFLKDFGFKSWFKKSQDLDWKVGKSSGRSWWTPILSWTLALMRKSLRWSSPSSIIIIIIMNDRCENKWYLRHLVRGIHCWWCFFSSFQPINFCIQITNFFLG